MPDPLFWSIAALAVFIVALAKSGLANSVSMVGVPLLTLLMTPREAAGVLLPVLLVMDAFAITAYRRDIHWPSFKVLLPGAIVGIGVGWAASSVVTDDMVRLTVGLITMLFVFDAAVPWRKKLEGRPPSKPWGVFWGSIAGFTSFVSHTGGPPYQVYMLPQKLKPVVFAGTSAWLFAIINTVKLVPYAFLGQLSPGNLQISLALVPVAVVGMLLGIYLVRRISTELFYRIAYVLIFVLGIKLTWDGINGVFFSGAV